MVQLYLKCISVGELIPNKQKKINNNNNMNSSRTLQHSRWRYEPFSWFVICRPVLPCLPFIRNFSLVFVINIVTFVRFTCLLPEKVGFNDKFAYFLLFRNPERGVVHLCKRLITRLLVYFPRSGNPAS